MDIKHTRMIFGATCPDSEDANMDLFWLIKMRLPDAHFLFEFQTEEGNWDHVLLVSALEAERASLEARNCRRVSLEPYFVKAKTISPLAAVKLFLEEQRVTSFEIHPSTPSELMEELKTMGFGIKVGKHPWYPKRVIKTAEEIESISVVQGYVEEVLYMVREKLQRATIEGGYIMVDGGRLTSEELRAFIELELCRRGCISGNTIVSSGIQSTNPHHPGEGPLLAHTAIVMDIFPYSQRTGYFADMTRTFLKGTPPPQFIKMYEAVLAAQEKGISMIRAGIDGQVVHTAVTRVLEDRGFATDLVAGSGFIHGTGHGLGLRCHEGPVRISRVPCILPRGVVVSVEPGLYYRAEALGVRIEDLVLVGEGGCRNLTKFPKDLKSVIIP